MLSTTNGALDEIERAFREDDPNFAATLISARLGVVGSLRPSRPSCSAWFWWWWVGSPRSGC